jgi:hypothetical protein
MRLLVTIAHYFKHDAPDTKHEAPADWRHSLGSRRAPFARIAALNAQIVALHRYFGCYRLSISPDGPPSSWGGGTSRLDIVIITVRGANLLEWIGLDPATYEVAYFDGAPEMLPFEAQRIMRERAGEYDIYGYLEDDLIIDDPLFFAKIEWFAGHFGPRAILMPLRFEMAHTGTPAKVAIDVRLSRTAVAPFRRAELPVTLVGHWQGEERTFFLPNNPHAGCFFVTDLQLKLWMAEPSFYDLDASWIDPLVSAATYAPGKVFGLYRAAAPDPWFLEIEHYGTRYAAAAAPPGQVLGEPPLLAMVEAAARESSSGTLQTLAAMGASASSINVLTSRSSELQHKLAALEKSPTRLTKALLRALWRKLRKQS